MNRRICKIAICVLVFVLMPKSNILATDKNQIGYEDTALDSFLDEHLMEGSEMVESNVIQNHRRIDFFWNKDESIDEQITGKVYTYVAENEGKETYQTMWDLYSDGSVKVSKDDIIQLELNEYLNYYSPVEVELWTKNEEEDNWEYQFETTPYTLSLYTITILGNQIKTNDKYFRIMVYFRSDKDGSVTADEPTYLSSYTNIKGKVEIDVSLLLGIILTIVILICVVRYVRKKKNSNDF